MNKTLIADIYNRKSTKDTDILVQEAINVYINKNIAILTDGLIKHTPIISNNTSIAIGKYYNITEDDWKEVQKSKEFFKVKKLSSDIKFGLIMSYARTKKPIFINFLFLIFYTVSLKTFFPNGRFDKNIMKYTVDQADGRTDFKKFNYNLLLVLNKKAETYINSDLKKMPKVPTDAQLIACMQACRTRVYDTMRIIANKYYENFNDPDLKIQLRYSTNLDGTDNLDIGTGIFENIRSKSVDNLAYISDKYLQAINLSSNNVQKLRYRLVFISQWENMFGSISKVSNMMLNEWMNRNRDNMTLKNFRMNFVKQFTAPRGIDQIRDEIDVIVFEMLKDKTDDEKKTFNKIEMAKYLYKYILLNLHYTALMIK
jgi:hypothetical protein